MATDRTYITAFDLTTFAAHVATQFTIENPLADPSMMIFRDLTGTKTAKIPVEVLSGVGQVPHKTDRTTIGTPTRKSVTLSVDDPIEASDTIAVEEMRKHPHSLLEKGELLGREVAEIALAQAMNYMASKTLSTGSGTLLAFDGNAYRINHAAASNTPTNTTDARNAILAISGKMDDDKLPKGWENRKILLVPSLFNSLFTLEEVQATHFGGPAAIRNLGAGHLYYGDMHIIKVGGGLWGSNFSASSYTSAFKLSGGLIVNKGWPIKYGIDMTALRGIAWCRPTMAYGYTTPAPQNLRVGTRVSFETNINSFLMTAAYEHDITFIHDHPSAATRAKGLYVIANNGLLLPGHV